MEIDLIKEIQHELNIQRCITAGRNEPDKSSIRSAWKSIGFYIPKKNMNLVTTWRR